MITRIETRKCISNVCHSLHNVLLGVTIERYVAVCLPLKARILCTFGRARMYVATIGVFALLYNIPRFWEVTWQTRTYENLNATITNVEPTELRNDPTYINVYITWLYLVVMYIIPFTCLAIFNLLIYKEVSLSTLRLICLFF